MQSDQGIYRELGLNIRKAREAAGMKQETLAERIRMTRTSITNIEQGNQRIQVHTLLAIAEALGIPPAGLLPSVSTSLAIQQDVKRRLENEPAAVNYWVQRVLEAPREEEPNDPIG